MNSLKLKVELSQLYTLNEFIGEHYPNKDIGLRLVVEEIFVNIVNYSDAEYVIVNIESDNNLTIEFVDNGIQFDPTLKENPETPKTLDETQVGGLGILLAKNYADEIIYTYENNENRLKIIKKVE
ncbi:ATP-binding protein [Methanobrevibacter sp.]|uniref:ATP-binding protein n=1 Tax=Methanobrevibacter sp. TaxID=66852 RepID=UPI0025E9C953|nr:ATP-binding protein [Methanobrevibacter sp.]MEE0024469.1 ATP-binding protein [Methanobrevibacter sp.]